MKIKKVLVSSIAAVCLFGTVSAFAASKNMSGGYAYLNPSYSGGMRCVSSGTIRDDNLNAASLYVVTTYSDGSTSESWSGVNYNNPTYNSIWEWAEDYYSIHSLYSDRSSNAFATVDLSDY